MALANTVNSLATNFHSAYDSHTDAIRSVTDQIQRRIECLSARNRELSDTRYTMANELEGLRDEVVNLKAIIQDLSGKVKELVKTETPRTLPSTAGLTTTCQLSLSTLHACWRSRSDSRPKLQRRD